MASQTHFSDLYEKFGDMVAGGFVPQCYLQVATHTNGDCPSLAASKAIAASRYELETAGQRFKSLCSIGDGITIDPILAANQSIWPFHNLHTAQAAMHAQFISPASIFTTLALGLSPSLDYLKEYAIDANAALPQQSHTAAPPGRNTVPSESYPSDSTLDEENEAEDLPSSGLNVWEEIQRWNCKHGGIEFPEWTDAAEIISLGKRRVTMAAPRQTEFNVWPAPSPSHLEHLKNLKNEDQGKARALYRRARRHASSWATVDVRGAARSQAPPPREDIVQAAEGILLSKRLWFGRRNHRIVALPSMRAILDDPNTPAHERVSGPMAGTHLEEINLDPKRITLKDRVTQATIVPFTKWTHVPQGLINYLCEIMNKEIDKGDTYPMTVHFTPDSFAQYWFGSFAAVVVKGDYHPDHSHIADDDWPNFCLGSFYIKPNYPGRSSHVCNGGFLVSETKRGQGVGMLMGRAYVEWAPSLGYTYSVFNLVYASNVASMKIWDTLGFKKIGRVPGAGQLNNAAHASHQLDGADADAMDYTDAFIYGRKLGKGSEGIVPELRFEKIKYYLNEKTYPDESSRQDKSRLRSAASNYRLENGVLYHKNKIAIADPQEQYDIVKSIHEREHMGINKTCAAVTAQYHWTGIKATSAQVINNCTQCRNANEANNIPGPVRRRRSPQVNSRSRSADSTEGRRRTSPPARARASARGRAQASAGSEAPQAQMHDHDQMLLQQDQHVAPQMLASQPQAQPMMMYNIDPDLMDGVQHQQHFQNGAVLQTHGLTPAEYQAIMHSQREYNGIAFVGREDAMVQTAQNAIENLDQQQMQNDNDGDDQNMKNTLLMAGYGQGAMNYTDQP